MDPANPNVGGIINPGSAPSDFQGDTLQNKPESSGIGPDFTQSSFGQASNAPQVSDQETPSIPQFPPPENQVPAPPSVSPVVATPTQGFSTETSTIPTSPGSSGGGKKAVLLGVVGVLLLGAIGGGIYLASRYAPRLAEQTQPVAIATSTPTPVVASAKVTYLEGSATSLLGDTSSDLAQGQSVYEGATIETEADTKVLLTFSGGSILRIGPSSKLTLTSLAPESMSFSQEKGITYAFVDDAGTGTFTVLAGEIKVEALGTAFSVEKDESVLVNVYESKVKITEGQDVLEVAQNKQFIQGSSVPATLVASELEVDNFLQWALEEELKRIEAELISIVASSGTSEDKEAYKAALEDLGIDKKELIKQAFLTTTTGAVGSITLTGQKTPEGAVSLSWTADGLASNGFRIVWSTTAGKAYPGDKRTNEPLFGYAKTLGPMKPGKTWYYRVCEWTGTTCGAYSNELSFSF